MINHPEILADIARQHRAEMIAAADEFRRAKQLRKLWKLRRKPRNRLSAPTGPRVGPAPARTHIPRNSKATPAES